MIFDQPSWWYRHDYDADKQNVILLQINNIVNRWYLTLITERPIISVLTLESVFVIVTTEIMIGN